MQHSQKPTRLFVNLALLTALLTVGLIVFGAVVRVTDSGLGCGNSWPLCDGKALPPLDNLTAWIEWSHRLFAALIGFMGLAMLFVVLKRHRHDAPLAVQATIIGAVLFVVQSLLGAVVVIFDLPPTIVTIHLGTAMLLLAALLVAAIGAWHQDSDKPYVRDYVTTLLYITTALSFIIILSGALVRGAGATLACTDWPLCNGAVLPFDQGELQIVHFIHRLAVLGLGLILALLVWYVLQLRQNTLMRYLTIGALVAYLLQAAVGALFVLSSAIAVWGATHVGLASITWALLVAASTIDTLNSRNETQWKQQSKAAIE